MKLSQSRYPQSLILFHLVSSSVVTLTEFSLIAEPYRSAFLSIKLILIWLTLIPFRAFRGNSESDFATVSLLILYTLYCWWGAAFRPLYELAFFQGFICMAFLRPGVKWVYPLFTVVAGSGLVLLRILPNPLGLVVPAPDDTAWVQVVVVFSILGILVHGLYAREREFREKALVRFGFLGRQAVQIAHDLKNLLQGPMTYIGFLRERLPNDSEDIVQSLNYMTEDLDKLASMVVQLNKMAMDEDQAKWISVNRIIASNLAILSRRLRQIDLSLEIPVEIWGQESKLNNIFFNLLLNSIESFQRQPVKSPRIRIRADEKEIVYTDNGEENIESLLLNIRSGRVVSSKANGGLGLIFIQEDLQALGAQIQFFKGEPGLGVRLKLPRIRGVKESAVL